MLVAQDDRQDYGEERNIGIGMLEGRIIIIIFTKPDAETIRIISMMKALTHEKIRYEKHLRNRLGYD